MAQKVIITSSEKTINDWLDKGWVVVSVTAQYVAMSNTYSSSTIHSNFCFVIEKNDKERMHQ
jgi:hypothetical protein